MVKFDAIKHSITNLKQLKEEYMETFEDKKKDKEYYFNFLLDFLKCFDEIEQEVMRNKEDNLSQLEHILTNKSIRAEELIDDFLVKVVYKDEWIEQEEETYTLDCNIKWIDDKNLNESGED